MSRKKITLTTLWVSVLIIPWLMAITGFYNVACNKNKTGKICVATQMANCGQCKCVQWHGTITVYDQNGNQVHSQSYNGPSRVCKDGVPEGQYTVRFSNFYCDRKQNGSTYCGSGGYMYASDQKTTVKKNKTSEVTGTLSCP